MIVVEAKPTTDDTREIYIPRGMFEKDIQVYPYGNGILVVVKK